MQDGTVRSLGDGNGYNIVDYVSPKIDGDLTLVYVIELDRESEKNISSMWLKGRFLRLASDSNFLAPIAGEMVKTKNSCILYMF